MTDQLVAEVAQAIRNSNGTPEAMEWWQANPQLVPAHVYAKAAIEVIQGDEWMNPDRVCDWLDVKKDWLYDQAERGSIPHIKVGRMLRFNRGELRQWLEGFRR